MMTLVVVIIMVSKLMKLAMIKTIINDELIIMMMNLIKKAVTKYNAKSLHCIKENLLNFQSRNPLAMFER